MTQRFAPAWLAAYVQRILEAAGTPTDLAAIVADTLVDADLKGVESHGVLRVPHYLELIAEGYLKPAARSLVSREAPVWVVIDGQQGFGHCALLNLCERVAVKAERTGVAFGGLTNTTHTGRIGWFAEKIAGRGLAIQITGGGAHRLPAHTSVAPYGGRERLLSTNPITLGWPGGRFGPVVADFSTSATAEGKVRFHRERGESLPAGWILDRDGVPSTNPADLYSGGSILPMGAHKGYGLSLFNEYLGGVMLGPTYEANWTVTVLDPAAFADPEEQQRDAEALLQRIKDSPVAHGHREVLLPGEREGMVARERMRTGIPIADAIWAGIAKAAEGLGVPALDEAQAADSASLAG